jgi:flagellar biogenesis protein FliO
MEEDLQDVFIAKMTKGTRNRLAIVDEKGRRYLVDVKAQTVTPH